MRWLCVLLSLAACARTPLIVPKRVPSSASTLFAGVRVFDGRSDEVSGPVDVVVSGGRVAAIGPVGSVAVPPGAERVEGKGRVLMPGLYDGHVHLGGGEGEPPWELGKHLPDADAQAAAFLYCGVTTAVLAGHDTDSRSLSNEIIGRRVSGPRLLRATRILTAPEGHPVYMYRSAAGALGALLAARGVVQASGEDQVRAAVRAELEDPGVHHLKVVYHALPESVPMLTLAELKAAIDEARKLGRPTYVHVGTARGAVDAAQAGAAVLMHTPWESELTGEQVAALKASGVAVVTTRNIHRALLDVLAKDGAKLSPLETQVARPGAQATYAQAPAGYQLSGFETLPAQLPEYDRLLGVNVTLLYQAGVPLIAGTDSGLPGVLPGAGLHRELEALVATGLPAAAVLKMATSTPARVLEAAGERGVIAPGAIADLLLVDGDPVADIAAIDRIAGVWQRGERQR